MIKLLKEPSKWVPMGKEGRARAQRLFSRERSADLHEALYRRLRR